MANRQASIDLLDAARNGNYAKAKSAIAAKADVNVRASWDHGITPLIALAWGMPGNAGADSGHMQVAKLLLENGADPNLHYSYWGLAPLHLAISQRPDRHDPFHLARLLLENGAKSNKFAADGETAFQKLVLRSEQFQNESVDIATVQDIPDAEHLVSTIELAIAKGANVNLLMWKNTNPFAWLSSNSSYDIAVAKVPGGTVYTIGTRPPLRAMAKLLESHGGEIPPYYHDRSKDLIAAVASGEMNINDYTNGMFRAYKTQLRDGSLTANVNVRLPEGNNYSPLITEMIWHTDIWSSNHIDRTFAGIKFLVDRGADVDAINKDYFSTPLYYLLFHKIYYIKDGNHESHQKLRAIADYLVSKGANVHATRCDGGKNFAQMNQDWGNHPLIKDFLDTHGCTQPIQWDMI